MTKTRLRAIAIILALACAIPLAGQRLTGPDGAFQSMADYVVGGQWIFNRSSNPICVEGATNDAFETCLTPTDPTADRTLTFPDATDTIVGRATTDTLTNKTLTTPLFTENTEDVTATNAIAASESGRVFFLNSATEFVSTLPAPAAGLRFEFIVKAAPSGASYTIVTTSSSNIIKGLQLTAQDAGGSGDSGTADDTISFVDGQAVAGDRVVVWSDGTSWFAHGFSKVLAGITFTQAS